MLLALASAKTRIFQLQGGSKLLQDCFERHFSNALLSSDFSVSTLITKKLLQKVTATA